MKIEFRETLSQDIQDKMTKGHLEYEREHGIDINYNEFAFVLVDGNDEVFGVLNAYTAFAEIYIEDMWVARSVRGKGYGRALISRLENHFIDKGYNNINLVTSAFQAPGFYKKCGYTVEFIRENKTNPKLTKSFFIKYL